MTVIGDAYIEVKPVTDKFSSDLNTHVGGAAKAAAGILAGAFAAVQVADFLKDAVAEGREALKVQRETENVVKSTGGAAHVTAGHVDALSQKLSLMAGVDDELVAHSENVLLTFTKVRNETGKGNDIFDQATTAALNMSAALGTDLQGATLQLGKALNDPIKGITALSRAGVSFTAQQKEQIKTLVAHGKTLDAQKLILKEFNTEFGGAAAAAADPMQKLGVVVKNLEETVGLALLPVINEAANVLGKYLPPALDLVVAGIKAGAAAIKPWIASFREEAIPVIKSLTPVAMELAGFVQDHLKPILIGLGVTAALLVAPFASAVAGIVLAYTHFQTFRDVVDGVVSFLTGTVVPAVMVMVAGIRTQFGNLATWVRTNWDSISESVGHAIKAVQAVIQVTVAAISAVWRVWGDNVMAVVKIAWDQVQNVVSTAVRIVRDIIQTVVALINGDWGKAWKAISDVPAALLGYVINTVRNLLGIASQVIQGAVQSIRAVWSAEWDLIKKAAIAAATGLVNWLKGLPGMILTAVGDLGSLLFDIGGDVVRGLADGIKHMAHRVIDAAKELASHLPKWVRSILGISSPSKVMFQLGAYTVTGFVDGLKAGKPALTAAISDVFGKVSGQVGDLLGAFGAANSRAAAQQAVARATKDLQTALADQAALPGKIAALQGKVNTAQAFATSVTPAELREIAQAEDAVATARAAVADADARAKAAAAGKPSTDQVLAQAQAHENALQAAKALADANQAVKDATADSATTAGELALLRASATTKAAELVKATENVAAADKEAASQNAALAQAQRDQYEASLDLQIATRDLADKRAEATGPTADLLDLEQQLADLRATQPDVDQAVLDARSALTDAQLAAVAAEKALLEGEQKLVDLGPAALQLFKDLATHAGLTKDQVNLLVGAYDKLRSGITVDVPDLTGGINAPTVPGAPGSAPTLQDSFDKHPPGTHYEWGIGWVPDVAAPTLEYRTPVAGFDAAQAIQDALKWAAGDSQLQGVLQHGAGGGTIFGYLAGGGPVSPDKWYVVGERGPELFRSGVAGSITPNEALGGGVTAQFHDGAIQVGVLDTSMLMAQLNVQAALGRALADAGRLQPVGG
ncbi:MAG: TP901 family tail tape measure protein [Phage 71_18]|nr:MAG: TP901 family tail tape measure protein [Phage 71_18]